MLKSCSVCGKDVSQAKRVKDPQGNYFCALCIPNAEKSASAIVLPLGPITVIAHKESPKRVPEKSFGSQVQAVLNVDVNNPKANQASQAIAGVACTILGVVEYFSPPSNLMSQTPVLIGSILVAGGVAALARSIGSFTNKPVLGDIISAVCCIVVIPCFLLLGIENSSQSDWLTATFWVVFLTSLAVAVHSGSKQVPLDQNRPYHPLLNGWLQWTAGCISIWIVCVPAYLFRIFKQGYAQAVRDFRK